MVKMTGTENMTIYAQAGKKLVWGEEGAEGYAVSKSVVAQCIQQQKVTTSEAAGGDPSMSMAAFNIESTMAGPIMVEGELAGVLYLDRRGGLRPFKELDQRMMPPLLKVFETYPDLTLGLLM
jgi:GAF domain-containing protein